MNSKHSPLANTAGFSLVELVVAVVVFAVGALAFAGSTAFINRQTTVADLDSERTAALISTMERIRSTDYDSLTAGSDSIGRYGVSWSVIRSSQSSLVRVITTGPGLGTSPGMGMPVIRPNVADTFIYRVLEP